MQWLLDHPDFWEQHRGEHVALSGYEMIAVGKTRSEVVAAARRRSIQFPFVQYLPKHEGEWLLGFSNQPLAEQMNWELKYSKVGCKSQPHWEAPCSPTAMK
jgi:hypothetical protein